MTPTLSSEELAPVVNDLRAANQAFLARYPGESNRRQPVHVVYGGAHLFKADTARKLGETARRSLHEYAPNPAALAGALGAAWEPAFAQDLYARVVSKLEREPVEDFRLDFEDGYGNRPDAQEDGHAVASAGEVAAGFGGRDAAAVSLASASNPSTKTCARAACGRWTFSSSALVAKTGGKLPENFVVTVPKVQIAAHVTAAAQVCALLEPKLGLPAGALRLELMVETPQAIIDADGRCPLLGFVEAAEGRCSSLHFGVYDYTASFGITAAYQAMGHPACDFARTVMVAALAGTGVQLSDGATNILPVGPHRGADLSDAQLRENREAVHGAWRLAFEDTLHSLRNGIYEGWDLHPAQFVARYAAVYSFFLAGLPAASGRLKAFVEKAALASLFGDVFDDAATGQGLLNFFLRGIACGAITEDEALATGLTLEEIRSRSFLKILLGRRGGA